MVLMGRNDRRWVWRATGIRIGGGIRTAGVWRAREGIDEPGAGRRIARRDAAPQDADAAAPDPGVHRWYPPVDGGRRKVGRRWGSRPG